MLVCSLLEFVLIVLVSIFINRVLCFHSAAAAFNGKSKRGHPEVKSRKVAGPGGVVAEQVVIL